MESINAKAIYLKNYGKLQPLRHNQLNSKCHHVPISSTRLVTQHYATHHKTTTSKHIKNYNSLPQHTSFNFSAVIASSSNSVKLKEKSILLKIAETKSKTKDKNKKETIYSNMWATKSSHKDAEHLELSLTKPTDKLFHQLNNVRLAERLLFAKSTREISNASQKQFYKEQKKYKMNISRMPSAAVRQRARKLSLKPWQD